jgi:hypothetical protein
MFVEQFMTEQFRNLLVQLMVNIIFAFVILFFGYMVALAIEAVLKKMFAKARVEEVMAEHGLSGALLGFTLSGLVTAIMKWIVFLWFLVWAINMIERALAPMVITEAGAKVSDYLVLTGADGFLTKFVNFLPELLKGVILLVIGLLIADFIAAKAREGMRSHGKSVGLVIKVLIVYFTAIMVLSNPAYGIDTTIFNYLTMGVSLGVAGAIALALGLGLKDSIAHIAKKNEDHIEKLFVSKE